MSLLTIIVLLAIIGFITAATLFFNQLNRHLKRVEDGVKEKLDWLTREVNVDLGSKLESAVKAVSDVHQHLGKLEESHQKIYEVGKDIASLQDILKAPKMRGSIGELFLEDLLKQIMPKDYFSLQYEFKSKNRVDAIIKFGQGIVPIDAKFPLDNFRKLLKAEQDDQKAAYKKQFVSDVKNHVKAISEKYIQPDEGTFDFALMYIPAENVYYETIIKDERLTEKDPGLFQYALTKKVIPVSPNSFYAYLSVILLGLKGMAVEKDAKRIIQNISNLRGELNRFSEDFTRVGRHLGNSKSSYDQAEKHLARFQDKLHRIESPREKEELPV